MVKPPQTRHSKSRREPVTIELEPGHVSRVPEDNGSDKAEDPVPPALAEEAERAAETDGIAQEQPLEGDQPETTPEADHAPDTPRPTERIPDAPPAAPPTNTVARGLGGLAAGILGGIIALAGAGGLQYAGLLPSLGAGGGGSESVATVQTEIASLKQQLAGIEATADGGEAGNLRQALSESAGRVDALSATLDQVKVDVAGLKSAIETGGAGENAGLQALDAKIAKLEKVVAEPGQGSSGTPAAEVSAINGKLAAVETAATAAAAAAAANDGRLGTIEEGLSAVQQNVTALAGKVEAQASQPKVALAIAVSALKAAVAAGGTFTSEVETFAAVAPNAPELPELRTLAEKGVPSRTDIAVGAPAAADAMLDAARTVDEKAGIFERLVSSAETLVKVRPVGPVEGAGVPETVARMEAALTGGDLAKAIAEYETLTGAPKAAGGPFMEKVRARLAAEQLVERATSAALKAA